MHNSKLIKLLTEKEIAILEESWNAHNPYDKAEEESDSYVDYLKGWAKLKKLSGKKIIRDVDQFGCVWGKLA